MIVLTISSRWKKLNIRVRNVTGNLRVWHTNSADFPGKLYIYNLYEYIYHLILSIARTQSFKLSSSALSQGADSSSETVQLQCTAVSEQQAGAAGPNSKVPHSSLPLHREYATPSQPGLESPNGLVSIQASVSSILTNRLSCRHVPCFTNLL